MYIDILIETDVSIRNYSIFISSFFVIIPYCIESLKSKEVNAYKESIFRVKKINGVTLILESVRPDTSKLI